MEAPLKVEDWAITVILVAVAAAATLRSRNPRKGSATPGVRASNFPKSFCAAGGRTSTQRAPRSRPRLNCFVYSGG